MTTATSNLLLGLDRGIDIFIDEDDAIVVDDGAMILYRDGEREKGERERERERERRRKGSFCDVCCAFFSFPFSSLALWHP